MRYSSFSSSDLLFDYQTIVMFLSKAIQIDPSIYPKGALLAELFAKVLFNEKTLG